MKTKKKEIALILQSKGGAGKSFLTYLFALREENNADALFIDLDNSTATSANQLKFLAKKKRLVEININNRENKIDRERMFSVMEHITELDFERYFIDCGAPESEQIPNLYQKDFTPDELKEFEASLNAEISFNVVIAGGSAYVSCMKYLEQILLLKDYFTINVYCNQYTFSNTPELLTEVENICQTQGINYRQFGDIYPDRNSGQEILINAKNGKGFSEYSGFAAKTQLKRELEKI